MRLLFVVLPERGHLNPLLAVAQACQRAGHEIAFYCHDDISTAVRSAGLDAVVGQPGPRRTHSARAADVRRLDEVRWLRKWCAFGIQQVLSPAIVDPLRAFARELGPDALCVDPLAYHGVVVAETEAMPWAGLSTNLIPLAPASWDSPMARVYRDLSSYRDGLFARYGVSVRFKVNEAISPWLNTVFTTEALVPRRDADNDHSIYVGPALPLARRGDETPFPWQRLPASGPIVYVSFGSQISYPEQMTVELVRELARDAHVVVALKDMLERVESELPDNVVAVRYAPQLAVLERSHVMVTHGGANSVMECLAKGRPMLVIPAVNDGPLQGMLLERAGVGFALPISAATAAEAGDRVRRMLPAGSDTRRRAVDIAASYSMHDGPTRVVELIAEVARTRAPVVPVPAPT